MAEFGHTDFTPRVEQIGRDGIARARDELRSRGVDPHPGQPVPLADVVDLDPEARAARLRERAQARTLARHDPGDDAA